MIVSGFLNKKVKWQSPVASKAVLMIWEVLDLSTCPEGERRSTTTEPAV
jgi:hypothetical protein